MLAARVLLRSSGLRAGYSAFPATRLLAAAQGMHQIPLLTSRDEIKEQPRLPLVLLPARMSSPWLPQRRMA